MAGTGSMGSTMGSRKIAREVNFHIAGSCPGNSGDWTCLRKRALKFGNQGEHGEKGENPISEDGDLGHRGTRVCRKQKRNPQGQREHYIGERRRQRRERK